MVPPASEFLPSMVGFPPFPRRCVLLPAAKTGDPCGENGATLSGLALVQHRGDLAFETDADGTEVCGKMCYNTFTLGIQSRSENGNGS